MPSTTRSLIVAIALAVAIVAIITGYLVVSREGDVFHVGFNTWVGYGPFYIAEAKGFYRDAGLNVHLERIEGTGERRAALLAGRLEAMGSTLDDLIVGSAQGLRAQCVLLVDESAGADGILADESIPDIPSLRGKRIAVQPGFVNHFFLLYILDKHGLQPSDVEVVPMEPDKAGVAFIRGDVDVAVTWEPHLTNAQKREGAHPLVTSDQEPGVIVDILAVDRRVLQERPEDVRRFIQCWYQAVEFYFTNQDEGTQIIATAFGLSGPEARDMLGGVDFLNKPANAQMFESGKVRHVLTKANELWHKAGFIDNLQPVDDLINPDYID